MLTKITSIPALENVLFRLMFKQKRFVYEIARLEYRIMTGLEKLQKVNALIRQEEENIDSLNKAVFAAGKGKVSDQLALWKVKAENKLFRLHLRKNKIDATKLAINQSKLSQTKEALKAIEMDIEDLNKQLLMLKVPVAIPVNKSSKGDILFSISEKFQSAPNPVLVSIDYYVKEYLRKAS